MAQGLGLLIGTIVAVPKTAQTIASIVVLTFVLTGGYFVRGARPLDDRALCTEGAGRSSFIDMPPSVLSFPCSSREIVVLTFMLTGGYLHDASSLIPLLPALQRI